MKIGKQSGAKTVGLAKSDLKTKLTLDAFGANDSVRGNLTFGHMFGHMFGLWGVGTDLQMVKTKFDALLSANTRAELSAGPVS